MPLEGHDRAYMQARIREEIARCRRFGGAFTLIVVEELAGSDGFSLRRKLVEGLRVVEGAVREADVVARVFDDAIALLLIQTDTAGARDVLPRIRDRLARATGGWTFRVYSYPKDEDMILALPLLHAA
jgi:GGDEF domain-containing protein